MYFSINFLICTFYIIFNIFFYRIMFLVSILKLTAIYTNCLYLNINYFFIIKFEMLNWRKKKPSQNVQHKYSGKKIYFTIRYFVFKHIEIIQHTLYYIYNFFV